MRWTHILSALVFATISTIGLAAGPLFIDVDEANPPFMFAQGGKPEGIYPALLEAAFKHMAVPMEVHPRPWKKAIQDIDTGAAGVGGIYRNAEREKKYDYSEKIFVENLVVYFNKSTPLNFTRIDDLKGKRIGVIRGWSYGDDFDNARNAKALTVEEVDSDEMNFKKLDTGRLDAVVAINESGASLMHNYKNIGFSATALSQNPTYLALAKSTGQTALLKQFDQAISQMQKSGEFRKIVSGALK